MISGVKFLPEILIKFLFLGLKQISSDGRLCPLPGFSRVPVQVRFKLDVTGTYYGFGFGVSFDTHYVL